MRKKIIVGVISVILLAVFLWSAQLVLMPKYTDNPEGRLISEYYDSKVGHDVIFVGDCEVYENFSTVTLWEKYGISSYIRGSAQQLIWQSYYLLEEMLAKETPQVVVFNVLSMKYGAPQNEAFNRMTLDGMKFSTHKINCIKASMTDDENIWSYMFPILRFHSRWSELSAEDFLNAFAGAENVSYNGYLMQTNVVPMTEEQRGELLSVDPLPDICFDYLNRMKKLCDERGVELVLVKSPTNSSTYWWYDKWERQIEEYAQANQIDYYNLIERSGEIGIDWRSDTYDGGLHLNVYGAEKTATYFGKILQENYNITDRRSDKDYLAEWNELCKKYNDQRNTEENMQK